MLGHPVCFFFHPLPHPEGLRAKRTPSSASGVTQLKKPELLLLQADPRSHSSTVTLTTGGRHSSPRVPSPFCGKKAQGFLFLIRDAFAAVAATAWIGTQEMFTEPKPVKRLPYYVSRKQIFLTYNTHTLRTSLGIHGAQQKAKHFPAFSTTPDLVPGTGDPPDSGGHRRNSPSRCSLSFFLW